MLQWVLLSICLLGVGDSLAARGGRGHGLPNHKMTHHNKLALRNARAAARYVHTARRVEHRPARRVVGQCTQVGAVILGVGLAFSLYLRVARNLATYTGK